MYKNTNAQSYILTVKKSHSTTTWKEIVKSCWSEFKKLTTYGSENNFVQKCIVYIERWNVDDNTVKSFNILINNFRILHNYFDIVQTKLFLDFYLAKFLDNTLPFFSYMFCIDR